MMSVFHPETQILEYRGVVHQVQTGVYFVSLLSHQNQGVFDELLVADRGGEIVERITDLNEEEHTMRTL